MSTLTCRTNQGTYSAEYKIAPRASTLCVRLSNILSGLAMLMATCAIPLMEAWC